jgi:hypothetical protein
MIEKNTDKLWKTLTPEQRSEVGRLLAGVADLVAGSPGHYLLAWRTAVRSVTGRDRGDFRAILAARLAQDRRRGHGGEGDRVSKEQNAKHLRRRGLSGGAEAEPPPRFSRFASGVIVRRGGRDPSGDADIVAPWDRFLLLSCDPNPVVAVGVEGERTSLPRLVVAGLDRRLADLLVELMPEITKGGVTLDRDAAAQLTDLSRAAPFCGPDVDTSLPGGVRWTRCERLRDVAMRLFGVGRSTLFDWAKAIRAGRRLPPVGPGHCPYCRLPLGRPVTGRPRRYDWSDASPWQEQLCDRCCDREAAWVMRPAHGGRVGSWTICPGHLGGFDGGRPA